MVFVVSVLWALHPTQRGEETLDPTFDFHPLSKDN